MTQEQREIFISLGRVRCLPGSFDKRFIRNLSTRAETSPQIDLTQSQIELMYRLLYKYRAQLPRLYNIHKGHPFCSKKN